MKKSWKKGRWFENTVIFICTLNRMRKSLIVLVFHFTTLALYGQVLMDKDSLLKLLPQAKEDTNAVHLYINIGQHFSFFIILNGFFILAFHSVRRSRIK